MIWAYSFMKGLNDNIVNLIVDFQYPLVSKGGYVSWLAVIEK